MIRVGVVGAGGHSKHVHGPALADCREACSFDVELRAVCDLKPARAEEYAERFGFRSTYRDVDEMYAVEPLDAVVAVTPVDATRDVAGDLLRRGVPLLIEKPPGRTAVKTRELRDVASREGTPHAVSLNRRFDPAFQRAREWLEESVPESPPRLAVSRMLRDERLEDDFLIGTGIHAVDTVCSVLGSPTHVTAERWQSRGRSGGDCCVARATFEDATAEFVVAPDAGSHAETYELIGPEYAIRIDVGEGALSVTSGGDEVLFWRQSRDEPGHVSDGTFAETRAFLRAVRRGAGFSPTLDDVLPSMRLAEALDAGGDHAFE